MKEKTVIFWIIAIFIAIKAGWINLNWPGSQPNITPTVQTEKPIESKPLKIERVEYTNYMTATRNTYYYNTPDGNKIKAIAKGETVTYPSNARTWRNYRRVGDVWIYLPHFMEGLNKVGGMVRTIRETYGRRGPATSYQIEVVIPNGSDLVVKSEESGYYYILGEDGKYYWVNKNDCQ